MLKLQNLTLQTRQPILTNCNYSFADGAFYQITAENGAGKTSLLRAMTNLIPFQGQIEFDGRPYEQVRDQVFFFESNDWLNPSLNALDYLKLVQKKWHSNVDLAKELDFMGVGAFVKLPIKKYSLGMKQKLLIAMYFTSGAKYLLMDEISNGLDEASRQQLYQRLAQEAGQGKIILLTSHYASEVRAFQSQRLQLMNGSLKEVESDVVHDF